MTQSLTLFIFQTLRKYQLHTKFILFIDKQSLDYIKNHPNTYNTTHIWLKHFLHNFIAHFAHFVQHLHMICIDNLFTASNRIISKFCLVPFQ